MSATTAQRCKICLVRDVGVRLLVERSADRVMAIDDTERIVSMVRDREWLVEGTARTARLLLSAGNRPSPLDAPLAISNASRSST